ncbi:MAG: cyclase family protein, partial [Candidatus Bathyarchaeia archaeon]
TFMGEAVGINLNYKKPGDLLTPEDLEKAGVKPGDIVLIWSPYTGDERPKISPEAAEWLSNKRIKLLGVDNSIQVEWSYSMMATHENMLKNDIPIVERLANLNQLKKRRFFFIGLPLKIRNLDSSWIRAIALEELDSEE